MNVIRLSAYAQSDIYRKGNDVYVNADKITAFKPCTNAYGEFRFTQIDVVGGGSYKVKETPEEIMEMIKIPTIDDYLLRDAIKVGGFIEEEE